MFAYVSRYIHVAVLPTAPLLAQQFGKTTQSDLLPLTNFVHVPHFPHDINALEPLSFFCRKDPGSLIQIFNRQAERT